MDKSNMTSARSSFTLDGSCRPTKHADTLQSGEETELVMVPALVGTARSDTGSSSQHRAEGELEKFSYGFFAPELKEKRTTVYKILTVSMIITIVVMWSCLPLYWGSLWKSRDLTHNLTVRILDFDQDVIGHEISSSLLSERSLNYFSGDISYFPTNASIVHDVVQEGVWATITINPNVTSKLALARINGDTTYNPSSAISVYYSQARQETAVNSYLVPLIQAALKTALGKTAPKFSAEFISQNAGNATAMANIASAPLTINPAIFYNMINLRPYNQPVATAITIVGLIYNVIFAVIVTMANFMCQHIISPYLTTRSYLLYRLVSPAILFLILSFFFAMVSLPFDVHFGAHFTYAGGFFLWSFTVFLSMISTGLAAEFALAVLGDKLLAYFMIPLIIANVSVASLPHELQVGIFRYGVAMPFYNVSRVVRTIIFDTKNEIGKNIGILLAWTAVSMITVSLATLITRRKELRAHTKGKSQESEKA